MAITAGTDLLALIIQDTVYFNLAWFSHAFLVLASLLIITRDIQSWKKLLLPVAMAWHIAGVEAFLGMYLAGAFFFITEYLSLSVLGTVLSSSTRYAGSIAKGSYRVGKKISPIGVSVVKDAKQSQASGRKTPVQINKKTGTVTFPLGSKGAKAMGDNLARRGKILINEEEQRR